MDLDRLNLLGFEKLLVAKGRQAQLKRLEAESPTTHDENQRAALARGLAGCAALWVIVGIPIVGVALVLQLTVGWWSLIAWMGVVACFAMNRWRLRQSKRLIAVHNG